MRTARRPMPIRQFTAACSQLERAWLGLSSVALHFCICHLGNQTNW